MKNLLKQLNKSKDVLSSERDKLRILLDEVDSQLVNCEEGIELLEQSIDKFSEYV